MSFCFGKVKSENAKPKSSSIERQFNKSQCNVFIIGPFSSGKTCLLRQVTGESTKKNPVIRTLGISLKKARINGYKVLFHDIGGSEELIPEWDNFYSEMHAFIFVIDSTNKKNVLLTAKLLLDTLNHPEVKDKPFLIVATKMDTLEGMSECVLFNAYDMSTILSKHRFARFAFSDEVKFLHPVLAKSASEFLHGTSFHRVREDEVGIKNLCINSSFFARPGSRSINMDGRGSIIVNTDRRSSPSHPLLEKSDQLNQRHNETSSEMKNFNAVGRSNVSPDIFIDSSEFKGNPSKENNSRARIDLSETEQLSRNISGKVHIRKSQGYSELNMTKESCSVMNSASCSDMEMEDVFYETIFSLSEGIIFILEFVESNRRELDARVAAGRKLIDQKNKKRLIRLQANWTKHVKRHGQASEWTLKQVSSAHSSQLANSSDIQIFLRKYSKLKNKPKSSEDNTESADWQLVREETNSEQINKKSVKGPGKRKKTTNSEELAQ